MFETTEKEKPVKSFAKLGFSQLETVEIVEALNILLANYHVHYQKLRNFHWNVEGQHFFELHLKFEELYNEVKINIDDVAERIRVFGARPLSTLGEYLKLAVITEVIEPITAFQMVKEVMDDFEKLLSQLDDAAKAAAQIGDTGTEDMLIAFKRSIEKNHWMFTAWLKNQS